MSSINFMFHLSLKEAKRLRDKLDTLIEGKHVCAGFATKPTLVRIEQRLRLTKADGDLLTITCGEKVSEAFTTPFRRGGGDMRPLLNTESPTSSEESGDEEG